MKTSIAFLALVALPAVNAQTWPSLNRLATDAALIVLGRATKSDETGTQFAVFESWKGAYIREAFANVPPAGSIVTNDKSIPVNSERILIFLARSRTGGKLQQPDFVVPVVEGKITYPLAPSGGIAPKQFTLAAFKAQLQSAVRFPLVNGDFDASPIGSVPDGWTAAYPTGGGVVASEGKDTFLRLTSERAENAGVAQIFPIPEKSARIVVLGRMRGKAKNEKDEKRAAAEVAIRFLDAKGGSLNSAIVTSGNAAGWRTFRRDFAVPPGSDKVEVVARSIFAIGTFDFDEVRVEFK